MMMVTVNDCITLISFKMRESSLGTPVGNDDAVLSSFSVLPELLEIDPVISLHCSLISYCLSTLNLQTPTLEFIFWDLCYYNSVMIDHQWSCICLLPFVLVFCAHPDFLIDTLKRLVCSSTARSITTFIFSN